MRIEFNSDITSRNIGKILYFISSFAGLKSFLIRISSYFRNHRVVFSFVLSTLVVIALHFTYVVLADRYPPEMIGKYIIYVEYAEGYGTTHRYMLIDIYCSLIFLFFIISLPARASVENLFDS